MSDAPPPTMPAAMLAGIQHRLLQVFAGTWHATVHLWMQPGADPVVSEGTMTNAWVLGDRFLAQHYESTQCAEDGTPVFEGRGFWGFNNGTGQYEGFWIDSGSTVMQTETGSYDPDTRTFTMEGQIPHPVTGEPLARRTLITVRSDDEHHMEAYMPGPGGALRKTMTIAYSRA